MKRRIHEEQPLWFFYGILVGCRFVRFVTCRYCTYHFENSIKANTTVSLKENIMFGNKIIFFKNRRNQKSKPKPLNLSKSSLNYTFRFQLADRMVI